ncbi:MAG: hypothetical protein QM613_06760 [Micrococcaceae bacterium]
MSFNESTNAGISRRNDKATNAGISRRSLAKGVLWSVPAISAAVAAPANAASCTGTTSDTSILSYTVDSATGMIQVTNTSDTSSTSCATYEGILWAYTAVFGFPYTSAPLSFNGVNATRGVYNGTVKQYSNMGAQSIPAGSTIYLPIAVVYTTGGLSMTSGTYSGTRAIYLTAGSTLASSTALNQGGSIIQTFYGSYNTIGNS